MKLRFLDHLLSTGLVTLLLLGFMFVSRNNSDKASQIPPNIAPFVNWEFVDLGAPFEKALFSDLLNTYYPGRQGANEKIVSDLTRFRQDQLMRSLQGSQYREGLNTKKMGSLLFMYLKFLLVYVIVMFLTWYGVQTLAVWRFVAEKREALAGAGGKGGNAAAMLIKYLKKTGAALGSMVLFTPAYIIAYSMRTEFNTDMLIFVVLLATVSNGLLAMYSTKFYTFLNAESRKGYVETAVVKNLDNDYRKGFLAGGSNGAIFRLRKRFDSHVFGHIFKNAEFQYLPTLKEQAAFLITGLIIIEMALNIHGHLSYEMLKQLLYRNYDIVIVILLMIFYTVKLTEIFTDAGIALRHRKYANLNLSRRENSP